MRAFAVSGVVLPSLSLFLALSQQLGSRRVRGCWLDDGGAVADCWVRFGGGVVVQGPGETREALALLHKRVIGGLLLLGRAGAVGCEVEGGWGQEGVGGCLFRGES